jgi:hypothetical protein
MKRTTAWIVGMSALTLVSVGAWAQDTDAGEEDGLDVTMTLMPEGSDESAAITNEIELPTKDSEEEDYIPSEQAVENSRVGLDTANAARDDGRAFGEEAKNLAEDNRERFGRGSRTPDLDSLIPEGAPAAPSVPEPPSQP